MGTYYGLGIITNVVGKSINEPVSLDEEGWKNAFQRIVDTDLFHLSYNEERAEIFLKGELFEENIEDAFRILTDITGENYVSYYLKDYGVDLTRYPKHKLKIKSLDHGISNNRNHILEFYVDMALLFIEGKVMVEEFRLEPKLINWLFRKCKNENKLFGCMYSDIVG